MSDPFLQISYSLSNIGKAADHFWQYVYQHKVLAFNGQMGAGKTTFIHALCDHLNVSDPVSSPTFTLVNEYHYKDKNKLDNTIFHMDWYRLEDEEEIINAGIEDALFKKDTYCFIEWAEKAIRIIPRPYLLVNIEIAGRDERKIICNLIS